MRTDTVCADSKEGFELPTHAVRAPFKPTPLRGEILRALPCFSHMSADESEALAERMNGRLYAERREVISQDEDEKSVFFLLAGHVQATTFSRAGRVITFQELRDGEMFGEMAAIDGGPRTANIVTLTECLVARMTASHWWESVSNDRAFREAAFKRLTTLARRLCERVAEFHALSVPDRIKMELYRLARLQERKSNEVTISPCPTQAELASRVGTHREAVTREISELARRGLVHQSRRELRIVDFDGLVKLVRVIQQSPTAS